MVLGGHLDVQNWISQIHFDNHFHCTGFYITPNVIATAAHCFADYSHSRFAINNRQIHSISMHPHYSAQTLVGDIALVSLMPNNHHQSYQNNIILDAHGLYAIPNRPSTISGFGAYPLDLTRIVLTSVSLPIMSIKDCSTQYAKYNMQLYPTSMLCIGDDQVNTGTCKGDSGSPSYIRDVYGTIIVFGLVSFGLPKCGDGDPTIVSTIASSWTWIQQSLLDGNESIPEIYEPGKTVWKLESAAILSFSDQGQLVCLALIMCMLFL